MDLPGRVGHDLCIHGAVIHGCLADGRSQLDLLLRRNGRAVSLGAWAHSPTRRTDEFENCRTKQERATEAVTSERARIAAELATSRGPLTGCGVEAASAREHIEHDRGRRRCGPSQRSRRPASRRCRLPTVASRAPRRPRFHRRGAGRSAVMTRQAGASQGGFGASTDRISPSLSASSPRQWCSQRWPSRAQCGYPPASSSGSRFVCCSGAIVPHRRIYPRDRRRSSETPLRSSSSATATSSSITKRRFRLFSSHSLPSQVIDPRGSQSPRL